MLATHFNYADSSNSIFCKASNAYVKNDMTQGQKCIQCPYFVGALQGEGAECRWDDPDATTDVVYVENPTQELFRVSRLIDNKMIKKG